MSSFDPIREPKGVFATMYQKIKKILSKDKSEENYFVNAYELDYKPISDPTDFHDYFKHVTYIDSLVDFGMSANEIRESFSELGRRLNDE